MNELTNVQKLALQRQEKENELQKEKQLLSLENISQMFSMNQEILVVLQKTVAKNTTPAEFVYFLSVCKAHGLNPINKEIWCYKNGTGDVIVFTGRDGFLKKNKENPLYRGMRSSEVCEFDEFDIDMISGEVRHKITNNRGKVIGAYAIVSIEGQKDTIVYLDFDEFNLGQAKWKTSPKMMIKKCAQSHALKEAAGITGIQAEEAFSVTDGVASANVIKEEKNHEEERLLNLIAKAGSVQKLEEYFIHCNTDVLKSAYSNRLNELKISV